MEIFLNCSNTEILEFENDDEEKPLKNLKHKRKEREKEEEKKKNSSCRGREIEEEKIKGKI